MTSRCLRDDLGLPAEYVARDARHFCAEHESLQTFVAKRSGAPDEGEPALHMGAHGLIKTLHVGRARAITAYDRERDVCWLLAYGETHAKGEKRDAFNDFEALFERGELMPSAEDFETLYHLTTAAQIDSLKELSAELYEEARANPGTEASQTIGLRDEYQGEILIVIDLQVIGQDEAEQGWVIFTIPPQTGITETQLYDVLEAFLPAAVDLASVVQVRKVGDRELQYHELGWTWSCYPDV